MADTQSGGRRSKRVVFAAAVAVVTVFLLGYWTRAGLAPEAHPMQAPDALQSQNRAPEPQFWTCSMHPQIRQSAPGQCPICGMDLVAVYSMGKPDGREALRQLVVTEEAKALMDVETAVVERRFVEAEVPMVGKVDFDETRLAHITAWVSGRIDRLYVDYTGIRVKKGDHMVYLYSPDLIAAQEELRQALRSVGRLSADSSPAVLRETAQATLDAARDKLRRWGLTASQIERAEQGGSFPDHVTIYAPIGGTVIERHGQEGMYIEEGARIYTIADLEQVWVKLAAYESDLAWLRYGQNVSFTVEAWPGERFEGRIVFIAPVLNTMTRTADVRLNVPNPDGRLKPEMFVRAVAMVAMGTGGGVVAPDLEGKWISPMHPEIIKDEPGTCDICGMPLVRANELGLVSASAGDMMPPLVIPASAPLITGKRAVVYVEAPNADAPTYEGREVVLGPRAGDFYVVAEGLREGERVVTNGNFKIDSALQIQAAPSMMNPEGGGREAHAHHAAMQSPAPEAEKDDRPVPSDTPVAAWEHAEARPVKQLVNDYFAIHEALARDDAAGAQGAARRLRGELGDTDAPAGVEAPLRRMAEGEAELPQLRRAFSSLSDAFARHIESGATGDTRTVYVLECPMAFGDEKARWLQPDEEVRNPYYGSAMYGCGYVLRTLGGEPQNEHSEGRHSKGSAVE